MKKITLLSLLPALLAGYSHAGEAPVNTNPPTELARIFDSNKASSVTHPQNVLCSQYHQDAKHKDTAQHTVSPQG